MRRAGGRRSHGLPALSLLDRQPSVGRSVKVVLCGPPPPPASANTVLSLGMCTPLRERVLVCCDGLASLSPPSRGRSDYSAVTRRAPCWRWRAAAVTALAPWTPSLTFSSFRAARRLFRSLELLVAACVCMCGGPGEWFGVCGCWGVCALARTGRGVGRCMQDVCFCIDPQRRVCVEVVTDMSVRICLRGHVLGRNLVCVLGA